MDRKEVRREVADVKSRNLLANPKKISDVVSYIDPLCILPYFLVLEHCYRNAVMSANSYQQQHTPPQLVPMSRVEPYPAHQSSKRTLIMAVVGALFLVMGVGYMYLKQDINDQARSSFMQQERIAAPLESLSKGTDDDLPSDPADRIMEFLTLWERGQCDKLESLVTHDFEYRLNTLEEPDFEHHNKGKEPYQFVRIDNIVEEMCNGWANKWRTHFIHAHNLGYSYGSLLIFGVDMHERPDGSPCMVAYHGTYAATLSKHGKIKLLQEMIDIPEYNYYMHRCGAVDDSSGRCSLASPSGSNKSNALQISEHYKKNGGTYPESTLAHKSVNLLRHMWAKECDSVASKIPFASDFKYSGGHLEPFGPLTKDVLLGRCGNEPPRVMGHLNIISDGNVVTVSGHAAATTTGETPCIFFYEKSVQFTYSSADAETAQLVAIHETVDDSFHDECKLVGDDFEGEEEDEDDEV